MKYSFALAGLAALAAASDVHDLTKDTFDPFVKEHDLVLAECKCACHDHLPNTALTNMSPSSLRTVVRPLQSPCARVRRSCHIPQRQGDRARQD